MFVLFPDFVLLKSGSDRMRKIKMLAVDMDGTCLDRRSRMTDRTLRALEESAKAGVIVVPATGRCLSCLPHRLRERKDIYRYVITSNGARIIDCLGQKLLSEKLIDKETALALLERSKRVGVGITAHIDHEYFVQGKALSAAGRVMFGKDAQAIRHVAEMRSAVQKAADAIEEIQFYFLKPGSREKTKRILEEFPQLSGAYTKIYAEIFAKQTSKGDALKELAGYLGIREEEVACIGDGENDLPMFEAAGLRMAMGNAVPELKKKAEYILPANDKNGAAEGIYRYILS